MKCTNRPGQRDGRRDGATHRDTSGGADPNHDEGEMETQDEFKEVIYGGNRRRQ